MAFVHFAPGVPPKAQSWFDNPIQSIEVTKVGDFSPTADGACEVHLTDGARAYAKPRPGAHRPLLLVREKIASDLGRLLNLPVAPVVIREPDPTGGWPDHSSLSLACLASGRPWGSGGAAHIATAAPSLEALRVFWTWIADHDHNGNGGNLMFDVQGSVCALAAIDHAHSLDHGNPADPLAVGISAGYGTAGRPDCDASLRDMANAISSLDWNTVETIVRRLGPILTDQDQSRILQVLEVRRNNLARLLGV